MKFEFKGDEQFIDYIEEEIIDFMQENEGYTDEELESFIEMKTMEYENYGK